MELFANELLHLIGVMFLFTGIAGVACANHFAPDKKSAVKRFAMICHGVGLTFILVTGLRMLSVMGLLGSEFPAWAIGKVVIFLALGAMISFAKRKAHLAVPLMAISLVLGAIAGYLGVFKP